MTPGPLSPPDLANTVTAFCTIGAGVVTLLFCRLVAPQPSRWVFVWWCLFLTGIPTFLWHAWLWDPLRVLDVSSNLLLAWALQRAVLGDFYPPATRRRVLGVSTVVNLAAVAWMVGEDVRGIVTDAVSFGAHGGFQPGEVVLIADSVLVTALLWRKRHEVPAAARPLLRTVTLTFLVGVALASASGTTVSFGWLSHHALWHVVGAFGFIQLWAFNHVRFAATVAREGGAAV